MPNQRRVNARLQAKVSVERRADPGHKTPGLDGRVSYPQTSFDLNDDRGLLPSDGPSLLDSHVESPRDSRRGRCLERVGDGTHRDC